MITFSETTGSTPISRYGSQNNSASSTSQEKAAPTKTTSADKVTLSAEAQMAKDLEQYALPSWIGDYTPPLNILSSTAVESTAKAQAIFDGVRGDQKAAQQFLDNDPATQRLRKNLQMYSTLKPDLDQYGKYQRQAYNAAMESIGVSADKSYHDVIAGDPSAAERAHAVFKEVLAGAPNVKSLMRRLDVPAADSLVN